jgi:tRNA(Ile)-lysidine synthase
MTFSLDRLAHVLGELAAATRAPVAGYCLGFSGGLDSTVLLHALVHLSGRPGMPPLRAVHVDHAWTVESPRWAEHCARVAAQCQVPYAAVRIEAAAPPGSSPEAAARAARYAAYARVLLAGEALLTAHQADDQLETALLQWLRGGGLRGLAAMPRSASFANGWHWRPLLGFPRADLHAWAKTQGLEWLEDPANRDLRFDRSYLRHAVLPQLRSRWPGAAGAVARVASYAAEAVELESAVASVDLGQIRAGQTLALDRLLALAEPRQRAVIRAWLRAGDLPIPDARTLASLLHDVRRAAPDRIPVTRWPGVAVHRYRGRLYAVPGAGKTVVCADVVTPAGERCALGAGMYLDWKPATGRGLGRSRLPSAVTIHQRVGGERFREAGKPHSRPLRKWLQERGVVPWQRSAIPLVMVGGQVAAVGHIAVASDFAAKPGEPSWQLDWTQRPLLFESEFLADGVSSGGHTT